LSAHARQKGEIERVIGGVAGDNIDCKRKPGGECSGGHEFELWEIGSVILAVSVLHQSVGFDGVIAIGSSSIEAALFDGNVIDLAGGTPEISFEAGPVGIVQSPEEDAEAIVGAFDGPDGLSEQGIEEMNAFGSPILDVDFAMTGFGENESKPDTHERAIGNPFMEVMGSQMLLKDLRQLHLIEEAEQQWNVVDPFML
jgi:hypothetical protein